MAWTEERVATLRKLWMAGESASFIAAELGDVTKNGVIGKVHRLGLPWRQTKYRKPVRHKTPYVAEIGRKMRMKRAQAGFVKPKPTVPRSLETPIEGLKAMAAIMRDAEPGVHGKIGIDLLDLKEWHCRWPIGDPHDEDFHFCGAKKAFGIPYCEDHARLAYNKPTRRAPAPKPIARAA